ncbi:PaaI family thioesterase [Dactylosporangium sp. NPDC000521]|uniref:PaaI family thioesterase n=1 Tax=Dactylosporangium sp. NPDC000521 TaxID=3363975 RepID=UPI0036A80A8D
MTDRPITAGERFSDVGDWNSSRGPNGSAGPNLWRTLGFRRTGWEPGGSTVEWDATVDYGFTTPGGPVIQGGLVTAILDSAMGGACFTTLDRDELFLTADLRVEFFRPTRPGTLRAVGTVLRRTRKVVFCAAELYDVEGTTLAASRCTQVLMAA